MAGEPIWLSAEIVTMINQASIARFGGLSGAVRDENLLASALARPLNKWHYETLKPDLYALAAAYCYGLVTAHAFLDGNKRVAYIAATTFLELNGLEFARPQPEIVSVMLGAADGSVGETELEAWFRESAVEITPSRSTLPTPSPD